MSFALAADGVHSWCVPLDVPPETVARLDATLSADERARSARFRFGRDRRRFVVARGALRALLGRCLRTHPGSIRFVYNAFGKPALSGECGSRLKFNLAHSADLALIAIAADADIGVDVECIQARADYADVARCFFSAAEVEHLNALPRHLRAHAFFEYWTRREAYVKARGEGLGSLHVPPARGWSLHTFHPAPGYIGAVAVDRAFHARHRFYNFQPQ